MYKSALLALFLVSLFLGIFFTVIKSSKYEIIVCLLVVAIGLLTGIVIQLHYIYEELAKKSKKEKKNDNT